METIAKGAIGDENGKVGRDILRNAIWAGTISPMKSAHRFLVLPGGCFELQEREGQECREFVILLPKFR